MNIVIPMAGLGSRFFKNGIKTPKPLIEVNGKTLIEHSVDSLGIEGKYIFITRKYDNQNFNIELTNLLKKIRPNSIEIQIDSVTSGASETALYAREYIDNNEELVISNCDQLLLWNAENFMSSIKELNSDGAILLFKSKDPKNSFAEITNNQIIKVVEKQAITDNALVGVHYWKHGKDFVESADKLLKDFRSNGLPECYISETYNFLIKENKKITPYFVPKNSFIALGTPEDVSIYIGKIKEYYSDKPKTIFCDIDGTIIKHSHKFSDLYNNDPVILEGVINKFNEWDSKGYKIILTTARKESAREITEGHLNSLGLCWDMLIMGVTNGNRIIINDKLRDEDKDRAIAVNIITDSGFDTINWEEYGL